jgi:hypothetical protein
MVVKFINTIFPPPPQLSLQRRAALSSNSNGTWSVYTVAERTQTAVYVYCELSIVPVQTETVPVIYSVSIIGKKIYVCNCSRTYFKTFF